MTVVVPAATGTAGRSTVPARSPGPRRPRGTSASRLPGVVALLVVIGLTASSWTMSRPPRSLPATADAGTFSAERALEHLRVITPDHPTPIGSPASDDVRDYLAAQLRALGLEVDVQAALGAFTDGHQTAAGRVENVVATLLGTDPTGRVLLAAHYDTTFGSPGAADDKAAVAAVLETVRALSSGEAPRNDVVVLLTDGEEPGMLGAAAYADALPAADTDVVLNWEATGNAGPSVLFEATPGNAGLVGAFARWAPRPVGDSAMVALYEDSDQHTDLTVLQDAGYRGLNFALIEGTAFYHHSRDTVANLDPASVQHHGATMLALARGLAAEDLSRLASDGDRTFFTAFGLALTYPEHLVLPLAGLAAVLVLLLAVAARRRRTTTVPRLLVGIGAALAPVVVAGAVAVGFWEVLTTLRPGYGAMFTGEPFRPVSYRWALLALILAVTLAGYLVLNRRVGAVALQFGALFWLAVLGLVAVGVAPGASFYGAVPAAAAALAGLLALLVPAGWWRAAVLAAGAVPGTVLLVTGGLAVLGVMGLAAGYSAAVPLAMAAWLVLPLLDLGSPGRPRGSPRWALVPAAVVVVLTAVGLGVDRFDPAHPEAAHLSYVQVADAGSGTWVSTDASPHPWTARHASDAAGGAATPPLPYRTRARWTGPAPAAGLPAPEVSVLEVRPDGPAATVAQLQVRSARDAEVLVLHVDRPVEEVTVRAHGHPPVTAAPTDQDGESGDWPYELRFYDPPADGVQLTLRIPTAGDRPSVYVSDYSVGLGAVPGAVPRPPGLDRSASHSADLVVVGAPHLL
jgi:hypothetical protein